MLGNFVRSVGKGLQGLSLVLLWTNVNGSINRNIAQKTIRYRNWLSTFSKIAYDHF